MTADAATAARPRVVGVDVITPDLAYLAALAAAFVLQAGLFGIGFHRISFDESARPLMALDLSWANAFEPQFRTDENAPSAPGSIDGGADEWRS